MTAYVRRLLTSCVRILTRRSDCLLGREIFSFDGNEFPDSGARTSVMEPLIPERQPPPAEAVNNFLRKLVDKIATEFFNVFLLRE